MYLVNKNYGNDYPLAREDIDATNTYIDDEMIPKQGIRIKCYISDLKL